jgi:hypothetical protein
MVTKNLPCHLWIRTIFFNFRFFTVLFALSACSKENIPDSGSKILRRNVVFIISLVQAKFIENPSQIWV